MSFRSFLYRLASFLGDVNAVSRGPVAVGKRIGRKVGYKLASKFINSLFR